jgi:predicted branched-subunit amino acid permease
MRKPLNARHRVVLSLAVVAAAASPWVGGLWLLLAATATALIVQSLTGRMG